MDDVELDELSSSENLALQEESASELVAESDDLEDETDEELECEVVYDDMESDCVLDL